MTASQPYYDRDGILRVFPRRTSMTPDDDMAFVGPPPMIRPDAIEIHVSVAFSWDVAYAYELAETWSQYYPVVKVGGPAIDGEGDEFVPGRYLREGVTITSRGCVRHCPWCIVNDRIRLLPIVPGWIIQDNNLLATGPAHLHAVFDMLRQEEKAISFPGGLDARLLRPWMAEELRQLRIKQLFLAADSDAALPDLRRALDLLTFLPRDKKRCYVLWGFDNEPIEVGETRCRSVWDAGGLPFVQLYQPIGGRVDYPASLRARARLWQRPALTKAIMGERPAVALEYPPQGTLL